MIVLPSTQSCRPVPTVVRLRTVFDPPDRPGKGRVTVDTLLIVTNWLIPLIYLVMVLDYGTTFLLRVRTHCRNFQILIPIVLHVAFLVLRGVRLGFPPLGSAVDMLSVIALCSTILYWVMELLSKDRRAGVFVFLLIFLFQYTSSAFVGTGLGQAHSEAAMQHGWERLHVIPATFAYTALAFAAVYGLLHLQGRRDLKRGQFGLLFDRLPPLDLLGQLSWYSLLGGFVFITMSMITGAVIFGALAPAAHSGVLDHKVAVKIVIGSLAWVMCAVTVVGRLLAKWSLTRVSIVAVSGFVAIMILLVASILMS